MPVGELFINNKDAYTEWGISLDNTSLSALMTPAPNKEYIENESRLIHGKRALLSDVKKDSRDLTLQLNLSAKNETQFFSRYESFCNELDTGSLNIKTKYQPTKMYKTIYISCNQFSQFMRGIGKFVLRLTEPNPADRNVS